jgi:hypothetical protein
MLPAVENHQHPHIISPAVTPFMYLIDFVCKAFTVDEVYNRKVK